VAGGSAIGSQARKDVRSSEPDRFCRRRGGKRKTSTGAPEATRREIGMGRFGSSTRNLVKPEPLQELAAQNSMLVSNKRWDDAFAPHSGGMQESNFSVQLIRARD
jgi:hypothetical protein